MLVTQGSKGVLIGLEVQGFDRRRAEWQVFPHCKKVVLAKNGVTRFDSATTIYRLVLIEIIRVYIIFSSINWLL